MKHQNRLASETSPYLLQHAHNPVAWYPWGPEALARAHSEDKPILLSIGYAACHWCHVMERESFENEAIAAQMNESFVCIKVDREERPDLDEIYMAATVALSGSGGWPMTVFLTPDQRPFFAGTYFPPTDKYGRPGFPTLLGKIRELWHSEREGLLEQAAELAEHIREQSNVAPPLAVGLEALRSATAQLAGSFDSKHGGFGKAPKFPPSAALSLLLRQYRHEPEARTLEMLTRTLDGMKNGGMYDHLGGGFARYSTDERWLVPHFEKMLYDNAQLAHVYLEAYQVTHDAEYARVARETLDYVIREMQEPGGAYYSATDADSEGVEGKFFVWSLDELIEVLGSEAAEHFAAYYDVTAHGNWEETNILNTPRPLSRVAEEFGLPAPVLQAELERSKKQLYQLRKKRIAPLLDDKILTSWNGLMLSAMALGYRVLGHRHYLDSAERAARSLLARMTRPDGGLFHTARGAKAHVPGFLEDYAFLSDGLIALYEAGGSAEFLRAAERCLQRLLVDFDDDASGAFFNTSRDGEALIARPREGFDNAIPSANAVAARALAKLAWHLGEDRYRERSARALRAYGKLIERAPRSFATSLGVVDFLLQPPIELVLAGSSGEPGYESFRTALGQRYLPNAIFAHTDPNQPQADSSLPLTQGKALSAGKATLYVCRNFVCAAPLTDITGIDEALAAAAPKAPASSIARGALPGHATKTGTARLTGKLNPSAVNRLGATELSVSGIGFGGYRVDDTNPEHRAALELALRSGLNLIDTSTNYGDGRSERLIGDVLRSLVERGDLQRDEVIVVTKAGYVQGASYALALEKRDAGAPFPEMVEYGTGIWHCIHPEFLADQLSRSLDRLGLETVDGLLLHNPEYFLADAAKRGQGTLESTREEFYRRLQVAFAYLESEVARGRIAWYGVSSNTAIAAPTARDATEFARILAAATAVAPNGHHFRVLQVPLNLLEPAAVLDNTRQGAALVSETARAGVALLVNRPLNAILGKSILRLSEPNPPAKAPDFTLARTNLLALEREFRSTIGPSLELGDGLQVDDLFAWGDRIQEIEPRVESLVQWEELESHVIAPELGKVLRALDQALKGELAESFRDFRGRYLRDLESVFLAMRVRAAERSTRQLSTVRQALTPFLAGASSAPFARQALLTLLSVPGVTCVLLGARNSGYVSDALQALQLPKLSDPVGALAAVRGLH